MICTMNKAKRRLNMSVKRIKEEFSFGNLDEILDDYAINRYVKKFGEPRMKS